jgi:hypothetical protein
MIEYGLLRAELVDIQSRFEANAFPLVPLYHDLIWSPEMAGWTDKEYAAFRTANTGQSQFTMEEWELWPGGIACSRYYGTRYTPVTRLADFRHLAARAYRILGAIADLEKQGHTFPDGFRLRLDCLSDERPHEPGAAAHFGWLELISDAALFCPTARLQADNGMWHMQSGKGAAKPTNSSFISIHTDLSEASAEFLRYCLDPLAVVPIGNGRFPISLPPQKEVPIWDSENGELWYQGQLVKRFEKAAPHQRRLLDAFEASGWRDEIANPFADASIARYLTDELLCRTAQDLSGSLHGDTNLRFGKRISGAYATWSYS